MKCIAILFLSSIAVFGQTDFVSGQAARAEIGQPNFTAQNLSDPNAKPPVPPSANLLGAPGGVAYANGSLFVVDSNRLQAAPVQNRVLIYNDIAGQVPAPNQELVTTGVRCPVCQATANAVIGQKDFNSSDPGITATTLNTPNHVAVEGNIVAISDTNNNRVLIYNGIPSGNGAAASVVLGQKDFTSGGAQKPSSSSLLGPEGVWIQNGRLFVADTNHDRIMIWNQIPTSNNQHADVVLGQSDFNASTPIVTPNPSAQNMIDPVAVMFDGTHLFVTDLGNNRVLIWNSLPTQNGRPADLVIGQPDFTTNDANHVKGICPSTGSGDKIVYPYECAATLNYPRFALSDGTRLFIADGGNDRVIVFPTIPTTNGARGKWVLGQPNEFENIIANGVDSSGNPVANNASAASMVTPTALAFDGTNLYVTDPFNRRVLVFTPGENLIPNTGIANAASLEVFAVGSATISAPVVSGNPTITAGDELTISIGANSAATPVKYTYKVVKNDTLAIITQALYKAITTANSNAGDPNVSVINNAAANQLIFVAKTSGVAGDAITIAGSGNAGATETITVSGATLAGGQDATQVAPGTIISIFGYGNLTDQQPASADPGKPLPRQLAGVELYVDGIRAPLMYVSSSQINAQIPFEISDAQGVTTWVRSVRQDGSVMTTAAIGVTVVRANPGIFAGGGGDPRPIIATHGSSYGTGVVSIDGTIKEGDVAKITLDGKDYSYTVVKNDTLNSVQSAFIKLINADASQKLMASAAGAFNRLILTAKQPGQAGVGITIAVNTPTNLILTILARSKSSTSGSTTTTTFATCCANVAGSPVTNTNPAQPDEFIDLYATGLGLVIDASGVQQGLTGVPYSGPGTNVQSPVDALINGSSTANVLETGLQPGAVGIYRVRIQIGDNATTNLSSQLRIAQGRLTSNIVTIPVVKP